LELKSVDQASMAVLEAVVAEPSLMVRRVLEERRIDCAKLFPVKSSNPGWARARLASVPAGRVLEHELELWNYWGKPGNQGDLSAARRNRGGTNGFQVHSFKR
jgi:hypothetical protein